MTYNEAITAFGDKNSLVVTTRNGNRYIIEREVVLFGRVENDSFIYGYPVKRNSGPFARNTSSYRRLRLQNLSLVEVAA